MPDHAPRSVERHCDVCVIGASAAGLAAALQLGRQRRSVIAVDAGEPRNAPAAHMHGYLGREGLSPAELITIGRDEVRSYGGEVIAGRATGVSRIDSGFRVQLTGGHSIVARRVLAATGIVDELPSIDGLAEHDALRAAGVDMRRGQVRRIVTGAEGHLAAVELAEGGRIEAEAVMVGPRFRARAEPFASLGLRPVPHPSGFGDVLEADAKGKTAVPGLYAAGSVTDPGQQVLQAAAQGSLVGAMIAFSLADEDLQARTRRSGNEADWDHRYAGAQMWSGNPNGTLVAEASGLAPGRALDVGAGEGGDALWLAEQGWRVTASDISQRALEQIAAEAERRGLQVECQHSDANALEPFESSGFDLVSAQYASIPRTPDGRGVQNLLDAVAPDGTLLIVSHDIEAMRAQIDTLAGSRPFDPDAYLRVEDFASALAGSRSWTIEVHGRRQRPPGAASASHHVDDVVIRARRHAV